MAISDASYSRGNPTYPGGTTAPTRGTVDPMGYVERSLNQNSQQRSGLAQAALARLKGPSTPETPAQSPQENASLAALRHRITATGKLEWHLPGGGI